MLRLDDGESGQLTTPLTLQNLQYQGAPNEAAFQPNYNDAAFLPDGRVVHGTDGVVTLGTNDSLTAGIAKIGYLFTNRYGDSIFGALTWQSGASAVFLSGSSLTLNAGHMYVNNGSDIYVGKSSSGSTETAGDIIWRYSGRGIFQDTSLLRCDDGATVAFNNTSPSVMSGQPFTVASTTKVDNLNVNYLADRDDSYAARVATSAPANRTNGTMYIPVTEKNAIGTLGTLMNGLNADGLDGYNASDFALQTDMSKFTEYDANETIDGRWTFDTPFYVIGHTNTDVLADYVQPASFSVGQAMTYYFSINLPNVGGADTAIPLLDFGTSYDKGFLCEAFSATLRTSDFNRAHEVDWFRVRRNGANNEWACDRFMSNQGYDGRDYSFSSTGSPWPSRYFELNWGANTSNIRIFIKVFVARIA